MPQQYRFMHSCNHIGIGPIFRTSVIMMQLGPPMTTTIHLPFGCPFCSGTVRHLSISPGEGILGILSASTTSPFPEDWLPIRQCRPDDIRPEDWTLTRLPFPYFRQMAWLPMPCGELDGYGNGIRSRWRQRADELPRTRLAGMFSKWVSEHGGEGY
ncbi:hypothetical protein B0O99DRAFT_603600 [Bisporella sp. PMI_857]|nr:hypothetical protein B0O99DRAFT_603600 [Bisporella sp. PMI_857]